MRERPSGSDDQDRLSEEIADLCRRGDALRAERRVIQDRLDALDARLAALRAKVNDSA